MQQPYMQTQTSLEQRLANMTRDDLREMLSEMYLPICQEVEGWINHFYVGPGHQNPLIAAGRMFWENNGSLEGLHMTRPDGTRATDAEIRADYLASRAHGGGARAQSRRGGLTMPEEEMVRVTREAIGNKADILFNELERRNIDPVDLYRRHGSGPLLALLDVTYSAGAKISQFSNTITHINNGNLAAAARNMEINGRSQISASRRNTRAELTRQPADHQGDFAVLAQARGEPQPGVLAATVPQAPPAAPAAQETGQAHAAAASAQETAESAESAIASVVTSGAVTAVVPPRTPEVPMEEEWEDTATQRFNELLAAHTARLARRD